MKYGLIFGFILVAALLAAFWPSAKPKAKSGYEATYDLCMSLPATKALAKDRQTGHCNEYAYNTIYGKGGSGTSSAASTRDIAAESNANAFHMCAAIDVMGDATEACKVSGRIVTVTLSLSPSGAKAFCLSAVNEMHKLGRAFERGWTLQIKSPYSGDNSIAYCSF